MLQRGQSLSTPSLDYEEWRALVRCHCGQYNPEGIEPEVFTGWVRPQTICGFGAVDVSCNAQRIERRQRDIRLDSVDFYYAAFQLSGNSAMTQNDHVVDLAVGDVVLVDSSRPMTYFGKSQPGRWLALHMPRQALISHLGSELEGGRWQRGQTLAARLLFQLARDAVTDRDAPSEPVGAHLQLAIYDLIGALFAPPDPMAVSPHADKLFKRICDIIRDRATNPVFGPHEAATEAGISLRYLQKLFTARNSTCSHFIQSVRLDHAARLLHRRALLNTNQPISEIAHGSGFADYTNFARKFRRRFGHSPGAHWNKHADARHADTACGEVSNRPLGATGSAPPYGRKGVYGP
jgi:AraC family transcriptional regulator, positive regulator of tynA and feaB